MNDDVSAYLGDLQRGFRDPGGCEKITTLVRIARESQERLGVLCLDLTNAFNTVSRKAIRTALLKQPPLHPLLPIFDLYYGGPGQLMYYGDSPSSVPYAILDSLEGVRQGDVLGPLFFCVAVASCLRELSDSVRDSGVVQALMDDVSVLCPVDDVQKVLDVAGATFSRKGLTLNLRKCQYLLPRTLPDDFDPASLAVAGVDRVTLLGVPHGPDDYIAEVLGRRRDDHERLLQLICRLSDRKPPHAAMRLLQICGVRRHGYHARSLPPVLSRPFLKEVDALVTSTWQYIAGVVVERQCPVALRHALEQAQFSNAFGGLALPGLAREAAAAHYACLCLVLGPVISTLTSLPGRLAESLKTEMQDGADSLLPWATWMRACYEEVVAPQFSRTDIEFLESVLTRFQDDSGGLSLADHPTLLDTMIPDIPSFADLMSGDSHTRVQSIACTARRASEYLALLAECRDPSLRPSSIRVLSHSGRGSASFLVSNMQSTYEVRPEQYKIMVCRVLGLRPPGWEDLRQCGACSLHVSSVEHAMHLPHSDEPEPPEDDPTPADDPPDDGSPPVDPDDVPEDPIPALLPTAAGPERLPRDVLLDHAPRCPYGGVRLIPHDGLARMLRRIMRDAGAPSRRCVLEARGLAGTSLRRPGDITWFLYRDHQHLVVDAAVAGVRQQTMLREGRWKRPGRAARDKEKAKISADARSSDPVQRDHLFVPFVVEEGGRLGAQALSLLDKLSRRAASRQGDLDPQRAARLRTGWLQDISTFIHSKAAWVITGSLAASRHPDSATMAASFV